MIQMIQIGLLGFCFYYANSNPKFIIKAATSLDLMCGRFVASMLMHINVESEVRHGLTMMKYIINHSDNFIAIGPPFMMGLFHFIIAMAVEFNVMLILTSTEDLLNVVMKFVSLTVFIKIPNMYASSLVNHRGVSLCSLKLPITKYRKDNPI